MIGSPDPTSGTEGMPEPTLGIAEGAPEGREGVEALRPGIPAGSEGRTAAWTVARTQAAMTKERIE